MVKQLVHLVAFLTSHGEVQHYREDKIPSSAKKQKWDRVPELDKTVVVIHWKDDDEKV